MKISLGWKVPRGLVLFLVWSLSAAYILTFVNRGWIPHDEGTLAHSAERVLDGELPHRDFDEPYTGALSYLHAVGLKVLGKKLTSIRFVLLVSFLAFVPALYGLASRLAPTIIAGLAVLLGIAWSVPNYFAAVPSWYNLFLATFGILALLRYLETDRTRWLFLAGMCGGLSFLVKLAGIYYIAAALLFLVYREQIISATHETRQQKGLSAFLFFKVVVSLLFTCCLILFLQSRLAPMEILHFLVPGVAVCGFLVWSEIAGGRGRFDKRLVVFLRLVLPFGLGVAIPVVLFLIPYLLSDSLGDFYRGVFLLPQRRLQNATFTLPPLSTLLPAIPYAGILAFPYTATASRSEKVFAVTLVALLGAGLALSRTPEGYSIIWNSARSLAVVAVLTGCLLLARSVQTKSLPIVKSQEVLLFVSMVALLSLVQYPFAAPIYFCYTSPLVTIAILAVVTAQPSTPKLLHVCVLVFYLIFAVLRLNPGYIWNLGFGYAPYRVASVLDLDRGGLRVNETEKREYEELIKLIEERQAGRYLYATPDCPEVYFLSKLQNPTRTIYSFFDDPQRHPARILDILENRGVRVVVINRTPHFSGPIDDEVAADLRINFPHWKDIGRFVVRWKE